MGFLLLAAAAAAKKREEENSRRSSSNKSRDRSYGSERCYVSTGPSFYTCVEYEIENGDPVISPFFKMIYDRAQLDKQNEIKRLTDEEKELEEKLETTLSHFRQFQKLAQEKGFNIQETLNPGYDVSFNVNGTRFCTLDGVKYYGPGYMELPEFLQRKLEDWKLYKKQEEEEVQRLTKKVKKLEKACKVTIFNYFKKEEREKNKEKLLDLQYELTKRVRRLDDGYYESNIDAIEKLINLEPSELALFNEGVNDLLNCRNIVNRLKTIKVTIGSLESYTHEDGRFYRQAYEELRDEGAITDASFKKLFSSLFSVEIARNRGRYGYHYGRDLTYSGIVTWFVDSVLDENRRKFESIISKDKSEENNEEKQKVKTKK